MAVRHRQREWRGSFGLGGIDRRAGLQLADGGADPGQQATAAEGGDHRVDVRQVFDDFEADRAVAADEPVVVERMDERAGHAFGPVLLDRAPALLVGTLDDGGAEPFDGPEFRLRRRVHDHDAARRAGGARRQGHTLRGVARAHRPDTSGQLRRGEVADRVVGAANLERTDRLQRFQLEKDLGPGAQAGDVEAYQWRPHGNVINNGSGIPDRLQGNVSSRHWEKRTLY